MRVREACGREGAERGGEERARRAGRESYRPVTRSVGSHLRRCGASSRRLGSLVLITPFDIIPTTIPTPVFRASCSAPEQNRTSSIARDWAVRELLAISLMYSTLHYYSLQYTVLTEL